MSDHHLIESFVAVTGASSYLAEQYLARNNQDLAAAIEDFYAAESNSPSAASSPAPRANAGGKTRGVHTLRELGSDDEEDKTNQNLFTGGEKSALQVENPDDSRQSSMVERIFERARAQMGEPDDRESVSAQAPPRQFSGGGYKLGDSERASEPIAAAPRAPPKVSREIIFWRQGFTVGDGELQRYDDPANQRVLEDLRQGRVPVSVLGVEFGQDVDVSVSRRTDEDYVPPRPVGGFRGSGKRLGSPVPGEPTPEPVSRTEKETPKEKEDPGSGDSPVQIRFANGQRVTHCFNSSDTVADIYAFVRQHHHNDQSREFVLSHAFPVKPIEESTQTLGEAKLKNEVLVQRWK